MEHLGGDGAEQKAAERSIAVRGHDDQVALFRGGELGDGASGIAFAQLPADAYAFELVAHEGVELRANLGESGFQIERRRGRIAFSRAEGRPGLYKNMQQVQLTMEAACESGCVSRSV